MEMSVVAPEPSEGLVCPDDGSSRKDKLLRLLQERSHCDRGHDLHVVGKLTHARNSWYVTCTQCTNIRRREWRKRKRKERIAQLGLIEAGITEKDFSNRLRTATKLDRYGATQMSVEGRNRQRQAVVKMIATRPRVAVCKYGHPFTEQNTYVDPRGRRSCRQCMSRRTKQQSKKRKRRSTKLAANRPVQFAVNGVTIFLMPHGAFLRREYAKWQRAIERRREDALREQLCKALRQSSSLNQVAKKLGWKIGTTFYRVRRWNLKGELGKEYVVKPDPRKEQLRKALLASQTYREAGRLLGWTPAVLYYRAKHWGMLDLIDRSHLDGNVCKRGHPREPGAKKCVMCAQEWHRRAHREKNPLPSGALVPAGMSDRQIAGRLSWTTRRQRFGETGLTSEATKKLSELARQRLLAANDARTHCRWGHEYTPQNTRMRGTSRECLTCRKNWYKKKHRPQWITVNGLRISVATHDRFFQQQYRVLREAMVAVHPDKKGGNASGRAFIKARKHVEQFLKTETAWYAQYNLSLPIKLKKQNKKSKCNNGHDYIDGNVRWSKRGRHCLTCEKLRKTKGQKHVA